MQTRAEVRNIQHFHFWTSSGTNTWKIWVISWSNCKPWCRCSLPSRDIWNIIYRLCDRKVGGSWLGSLRRLLTIDNGWTIFTMPIIRSSTNARLCCIELLGRRKRCSLYPHKMWIWVHKYVINVPDLLWHRFNQSRFRISCCKLLITNNSRTIILWWPSRNDACLQDPNGE